MIQTLKNNKGQGFFGEELIFMVVALLAIAVVLVITLKELGDTEMKGATIDTYRSASLEADIIAAKMAWETQGSKRVRVVDLTNSIPQVECKPGVKACLRDSRSGQNMALCGQDPCVELNAQNAKEPSNRVTSRVALPVSIKNGLEFDPGLLVVTVDG